MGYDLEKYKHVMPLIHNTLKRMKEAGFTAKDAKDAKENKRGHQGPRKI
jgi:hypothetical protein